MSTTYEGSGSHATTARGPRLRRFIRYVGGTSPEKLNDPVPWKEYRFDICGWVVVAALVAALTYIGYQVLALPGR